MSFFNFQKIISASSNIFGYASKASSMVKSITPTIKDIKKTYDSYKTIKDSAKEAHFKEISSSLRPKTIYNKKVGDRSSLMDSLTLFYQKKN